MASRRSRISSNRRLDTATQDVIDDVECIGQVPFDARSLPEVDRSVSSSSA
jgi:hypothetical protein